MDVPKLKADLAEYEALLDQSGIVGSAGPPDEHWVQWLHLALAGKALREAAGEYRRTSGLMRALNRSEPIRQQHLAATQGLDVALAAWDALDPPEGG